MNLIKQIQLPNGRLTTNLGFGCSGILRVYSASGRDRLLKTAFEEGLTHFDVARMYGLGRAEGIVGAALKSVRDQITIATKFGLPYKTSQGVKFHLQSLARSILNYSPALKNLAKKAASRPMPSASGQSENRLYQIDEMQKSLSISLQQLQTEWVDLLFIHEPGMNNSLPAHLGEALQHQKALGQIGGHGLSSSRAVLEYYLKTRSDICGDMVQYDYAVFHNGFESVPVAYPLTSMFGVLNGSCPLLKQHLQENNEFTKSWSEQLNLDLKKYENQGIVILALALILNPQGMVLFFTSKPKKISRIIERLRNNSFSEKTLLSFRTAVSQGIHAR